MDAEPDDWRRQGQEGYLKSKHLLHRNYEIYREGWQHDHCEFCSQKISKEPEDINSGYSTPDRYHWICEVCFHDFRNEFEWTSEELM